MRKLRRADAAAGGSVCRFRTVFGEPSFFCAERGKYAVRGERVILHIDMNNFFASVECSLHPELRPYPIAVCGSEEERHGIVLAKNYLAKI